MSCAPTHAKSHKDGGPPPSLPTMPDTAARKARAAGGVPQERPRVREATESSPSATAKGASPAAPALPLAQHLPSSIRRRRRRARRGWRRGGEGGRRSAQAGYGQVLGQDRSSATKAWRTQVGDSAGGWPASLACASAGSLSARTVLASDSAVDSASEEDVSSAQVPTGGRRKNERKGMGPKARIEAHGAAKSPCAVPKTWSHIGETNP
mmetsp:Transcript_5970/g.19126  ORF Transcript_5970/g.19126 Transcript_5970/m.19126 type:complete len:209 (-) Transcript_5970:1219-1845(-)